MNEAFGFIVCLIITTLVFAAGIGYGDNVYKLCKYDTKLPFNVVTGVRIVGLFTPVGPIVGYMTFEGEK